MDDRESIRCARRRGSSRRPLGVFLAALALTLSASRSVAHAQSRPTPPVELRHDLDVELPAVAGLTVIVVGFRLLRDRLEPSGCLLCDPSEPGHVNAVDGWFRRKLKNDDTGPINIVSYGLAFGLAPISAAGLMTLAAYTDSQRGEAVVDVVAVAEGGLAAMLTTEVLESTTRRMRPYVHAIEDPAEQERVIAEKGAYHSFPAGHVVEAFGLAAASGVVATRRGYRLAPVVWGVGLSLGVLTAYTRLAADRHYFTDVLAGAAIGTVVGGGVPFFLHPRASTDAGRGWARSTKVAVMPWSQGALLAFSGSF